MIVNVPISIGDLVDKLTILEIKKDKILDDAKLANVLTEYSELLRIFKELDLIEMHQLYNELLLVNMVLWDIEDNIRIKEQFKEFDDEFIKLSRAVYHNNDKRCELKKKINILTGSTLVEEKQYVEYK